MQQAFEEVLRQMDLEYSIVPDMAGVKKFRQTRSHKNPIRMSRCLPLTNTLPPWPQQIFCAMSLMSWRANHRNWPFYPIPKLMIRRVGDHEQFSALRANELGDGTLEAREIEDCLEYVELFMKKELLTRV